MALRGMWVEKRGEDCVLEVLIFRRPIEKSDEKLSKIWKNCLNLTEKIRRFVPPVQTKLGREGSNNGNSIDLLTDRRPWGRSANNYGSGTDS